MSETKDIKKWTLKIPEKLKEPREEPKLTPEGKQILDEDGDPVVNTTFVDVDAPIEGSVVIKLLSAKDRALLSRDVRYRVNGDGELVKKSNEEIAAAFLEAAENAIVSVSLKRKEDGYEYKDVEDLSFDDDGTKILSYVGLKIVQGVKLGKDCVPA